MTALRPSGAGWEADVLADGAAFTCRLPDRPAGTRLSVTILDPPYFGPDGAALVGPLSLTAPNGRPGPGEAGSG
jgi:hypothetical protein